MKRLLRILLVLAIGFGLAMLIMAIDIYVGYSRAYAGGLNYETVHLFGIKIYQISRSGNRYIGKSVGINMGIVSAVIMACVYGLSALIFRLRGLTRK